MSDDPVERYRKGNSILFTPRSGCLRELAMRLDKAERVATTEWALALGEGAAEYLCERYPGDSRPRTAATMARLWASGEIKMPKAKRSILALHAMAKALSDRADAACAHAAGQAFSTIHSPRHAMGFPIYELTAIALKAGVGNSSELIEKRVCEYIALLDECSRQKYDKSEWADFIMRDRKVKS